jgi:MarR family transcriptional regulator, organic hydroperoxide resistance regulator
MMATETSTKARPGKTRVNPGAQAWKLMSELFAANRGRFVTALAEYDLWPPQWFALQALEEPMPMGKLAGMLHCDNSNVTGITDRLEQRGLVRRTAAEHDRRVKLLELTDAGRALREQIAERLAVPPEGIRQLSVADQRALRDIMRRALANS